MPARRFEPNWRERLVLASCLAATFILLAWSLMTDPLSVRTVTLLALAVLNTGYTLRPWRGHVIADDEGVTVHPGNGRARHVEWRQVRTIRVPARRSSPAIERYEGSEISLRGLIAPSEVEELARLVPSRTERRGGRSS